MNGRVREVVLSVAAVLLVAVVLIAAGAAATRLDTSLDMMMRDVTVVAEVPWYYGALSSVSIAAWSATAALAAASALSAGPQRRPMLVLAGLAALLCADEALQLHESDNGPLSGVPEWLWYVLYAGLCIALLTLMVRRDSRGLVPLLAGGAVLGLSVLLDLVDAGNVAEDSLKLVGAALLAVVPVAVLLDREHPEVRAAASRGGGPERRR